MSAAAYNTYYNMITRGTCDLALIDAALAKKFITATEATNLRAYWHSLNDPKAVEGLSATAGESRTVAITWTRPLTGSIVLSVGSITTTVDAVTRSASLSGFALEATDVTIAAVHQINGVMGTTATVSVTLLPEPTPEPTPEPAPEPTPDPEPTPESEPAPEN